MEKVTYPLFRAHCSIDFRSNRNCTNFVIQVRQSISKGALHHESSIGLSLSINNENENEELGSS